MMKSMRGTNAILDTAIDIAKKHRLLSRGASMIPYVGKPLGAVLGMLDLGKKGGRGRYATYAWWFVVTITGRRIIRNDATHGWLYNRVRSYERPR